MKTRKLNQAAHPHRAALKPSFRASLTADTLELCVYEDIGENWWDGSGVSAKTVKAALDSAGVFNRISIRINSPGGDAFEGVAILSLLRAQKKPIDVYVDGIAASAASVIAMAGDTITMGVASMMMVHNAWTFCMGDGDDMRKCGDTLDKVSASIGAAYVARTGKSAEEIKAIMDEETWMGAQECIDQGFATAIATEEPDDAAMALARSFKSLAKLKHVPETLKTSIKADDDEGCDCICTPCTEGNCAGCDCTDDGCTSCNGDNAVCPDCGADVADSNLSQYEARLNLLTKA